MKSSFPHLGSSRIRITALRNAYSVLAAAILLISTSCSPAPQPTPVTTTTPARSPLSTLTPLPTLSVTPRPSPTATIPAPQVCSPLAVQPLERISEIITQPFDMPRVMPDGAYKDDAHHGVDLGYYTRDGKLFTGTPVQAALEGRIAAVIQNRPPYGNMLMVETSFDRIPSWVIDNQHIPVGNSLYTLYAHLQDLPALETGQPVRCGQQLAHTGLTGFTGGPHLHFETRWGPAGAVFATMAYYRADATPQELANYQEWRMSGLFHLFDPITLLIKP